MTIRTLTRDGDRLEIGARVRLHEASREAPQSFIGETGTVLSTSYFRGTVWVRVQFDRNIKVRRVPITKLDIIKALGG